MTCITHLADGRLSVLLCVERVNTVYTTANSANMPERSDQKVSLFGFNF